MVPADALTEVEPEVAHGCIDGQRVAMQTGALRSRQLHTYAIVERNGVIAGTGIFGTVRKLHLLLTGLEDGQQCHVAQVANARTAEMQVSEAHDDGVAVVVARAPVPALVVLCRAELHEAEGHVSPEEHMAVATRADEGVDRRSEWWVVRGERFVLRLWYFLTSHLLPLTSRL